MSAPALPRWVALVLELEEEARGLRPRDPAPPEKMEAAGSP